ncbi:MAG: glycosyltransferase family 4 protein [Pseudomonadales bacterium]|nr:glycosyltransferase family 4 protein [Pseudomonadales bacterium]
MPSKPAIWFPTVKTNTGTDIFTERLVENLNKRGIQAEISWLPLRAEYAPWTVSIPTPPNWTNIVHINSWLHPRFIPKHLPVIATIHHASHHPDIDAYKGLATRIYHKYWIAAMERKNIARAKKVIAVSNFVADTARETLAELPIKVIYNGVDVEVFKPGKRARKPNEPFRLLYIGSWKKLKGVDLLPGIMRSLGNEFKLYYTGGTLRKEKNISMPENMYDIGHLKRDYDVAEEMKKSDALLFPSRSEGFGLVVIEAMSCGLPVICTNKPPLTEIVDDGINGMLCTPNNTAAFVKAIKMQKNLYPIKEKIREKAIKRFSSKITTNAYINEYLELIKNENK